MTLDKLLNDFKNRYGDTWYLAAVDRFLHLYTLSPTSPIWNEQEYFLLRNWLDDVVAAGVRAEEGQ